jgi:pimeloyl-ACP methyl ester carboxylesterase
LRAIRRTGRPQAHLAGISFGGLIASYCAAQHPEAVRSLTLISSPSPDMAIDERSARFLRAPLATLPLFLTAAARRSSAEIRAARPTVGGRVAFAAAHAARAIRFPQSPRTMAHWVAAWKQEPPLFDLSRIQAPTLVVTGEQELDRVVPVDSSLEYLARIPHARHATLPKTGHLGVLLEPARLADLVTAFLGTVDRGAATAAPDERLPRP